MFKAFLCYRHSIVINCLLICYALTWQISFASHIISLQSLQKIAGDQPSKKEKERIYALIGLISTQKNQSIASKLQSTNAFFNHLRYQADEKYQGVADGWQSPLHFLQNGQGDSQDFSFAKYFTLQALDIPAKSLRLMYVKSIDLNQVHMVLAYYPNVNGLPFILDNLTNDIVFASERTDLLPIYGFDGDELWLTKQRGQGF